MRPRAKKTAVRGIVINKLLVHDIDKFEKHCNNP